MHSIENIRKTENRDFVHHLLAIQAIANQKKLGTGLDKLLGEMLLTGFGQWHIDHGFRSVNVYMPMKMPNPFENIVPTDRTDELIKMENRDLVRHLFDINLIIGAKCDRCTAQCCQGCYFTGREDFNIGDALVLLFMCDSQAVMSVTGSEDWDKAWELVYRIPGRFIDHYYAKDTLYEVPYIDNSLFKERDKYAIRGDYW